MIWNSCNCKVNPQYTLSQSNTLSQLYTISVHNINQWQLISTPVQLYTMSIQSQVQTNTTLDIINTIPNTVYAVHSLTQVKIV